MSFELVEASVKSTSGNIDFRVDGSGSSQMRLSSTGLLIGSSGSGSSANLEVQGNAMVSQSLSIGSSASGSANLSISGSMSFSPQWASSNVRIQSSYVLADSSLGNLSLGLPYAAEVSGQVVTVKKVSTANDVMVLGAFHDGSERWTLPAQSTLSSVKWIASGNRWWSMSSYGSLSVASSNLVAWWNMDQSAGATVPDQSGNGHHLSFQGTFSYASSSSSDGLGRSLNFDGVDDYLSITDPASGHLDMKLQDWTIAMRVKCQSTGAAMMLLSKRGGDNNTDGYAISLDASGKVLPYLSKTPNNQFTTSNAAINDGAWHHVVVVFDRSADMSIYIDGVLDKTHGISNVTGDLDSNHELHIGEWWGQRLTGAVDDVKMYNRVLSAEEVSFLSQFSTP